MKLIEQIKDPVVRQRDFHAVCGELIRLHRNCSVSGPYLVAAENATAPLTQSGYVNGQVRSFLIDLKTGYRVDLKSDDTYEPIKAEVRYKE